MTFLKHLKSAATRFEAMARELWFSAQGLFAAEPEQPMLALPGSSASLRRQTVGIYISQPFGWTKSTDVMLVKEYVVNTV